MPNFKEIVERVPIMDVANWLNLVVKRDGKGYRAPCSGCGRGGQRALSFTPVDNRFYCWGSHAKGDCIELYRHIAGCDVREAACAIAEHFGIVSRNGATEPQNQKAGTNPPPSSKGIESVHSKLQFDHPMVVALGLDAQTAERLGIGWRQGGMLGGRMLIPCRLEDGSPVGYIGFNPDKDTILKLGTITLPA